MPVNDIVAYLLSWIVIEEVLSYKCYLAAVADPFLEFQ